MVGGQTSQRGTNDGGVMDVDVAAIVYLVQRCHRQERRKTAESANGGRRMLEAVVLEMVPAECVAPVVEIARYDGRQMSKFEEGTVVQQVKRLPAAFFFAQS